MPPEPFRNRLDQGAGIGQQVQAGQGQGGNWIWLRLKLGYIPKTWNDNWVLFKVIWLIFLIGNPP